MKKLFLLGLLLASSPIFAQESKPESRTFKTAFAGKKILFLIQNAVTSIEGYDGKDVIIEGTGMEPLPEEAKGLKPIGGGGVDNTGLNLSVQTRNDELVIATSIRQDEVSYKIRVPKKASITWQLQQGFFVDAPDLTISSIEGEIEVRTQGSNIHLKDIHGPVVAYTNMGKITAEFLTVNQTKPISLTSASQSIDVTLPADTKASLALSASMGNAFTDFDIKPLPAPEKKKSATITGMARVTNSGSVAIGVPAPPVPPASAQEMDATAYAESIGLASDYSATKGYINAPGVSITLNSTVGNIYLRKGK